MAVALYPTEGRGEPGRGSAHSPQAGMEPLFPHEPSPHSSACPRSGTSWKGLGGWYSLHLSCKSSSTEVLLGPGSALRCPPQHLAALAWAQPAGQGSQLSERHEGHMKIQGLGARAWSDSPGSHPMSSFFSSQPPWAGWILGPVLTDTVQPLHSTDTTTFTGPL